MLPSGSRSTATISASSRSNGAEAFFLSEHLCRRNGRSLQHLLVHHSELAQQETLQANPDASAAARFRRNFGIVAPFERLYAG
jgi:hypothetical protein